MLGGNGGMSVYGLPEMDAFTFEMWQHPGANSPKAGGYILYMPAENGDIERTLNGVEWGNYQANTNHHCVWQRRAGTGIVEEYVNGVKVGEIEFSAPIGGRRVDVYGRGTSGDSVMWMDEVTFFDYAKYNGDFTPPTEPYKDIVSGLNQNNNSPREVTVSGLTCRFANDPSYALKDATKTGIDRVWATADNKYFIRYSWDYYNWVITLKDTKEIIGSINLRVEEVNETVEFNYVIDERFGCKGYMTEALNLVKDYCFNELEVNRFQGGCCIENIASKRVMEKCSMECEGILRNYIILCDGYHDMYMFSIINKK
jgi:RimJ/RimL family protein N-acetyltransferase